MLKVANDANSHYGKFSVPKKGGGTRIVYQPSKELKVLQRLLHDNVLSKLPIHPKCCSISAGFISVQTCKHSQKLNVLCLRWTLKVFFDSIKESDVERFINDNKHFFSDDWSKDDTDLLVKIVCFNGRLTMGAVSSPVVSNAICYELDHILNEFCLSKRCNIYTLC
ncbi:hypothetical protein BWI83_24365 (plasmid) [Escherichia coli]|nr:hypothetical protein BWI83_24365 [Escherichia coli]